MRSRLLVHGLLTLGVACATAYQPNSFTGGYLDQQIGENEYIVTFKANSLTEVETVQTYALYRCAELTAKRGYDYFVVTDEVTDLRHVYGVKPEIRMTIKVYKGQKPEENPKAHDAREIMKFVGPKIGRPASPPPRTSG